MKGGRTTVEINGELYDQTLKLDYLALPLLVRYTIGDHLFVFAGPEAAYNVYNQVVTELEETEPEPFEGAKDFIVNATGGIGYAFENGINLRAAYSRSLTRVFATAADIDNGAYSFQMALGYTF